MVDRLKHPMGDIINLTDHNAVSLTYNRNTILHFFAVPSLIACLLHNNISMDKQKVHAIFRDIYPYIKSELFLQWDSNEIDAIFEGWIKVLIENKLLLEEGEKIVRPAIGSDQFVQLSILSRFIIQTLERYYISVAILINKGSGQIDASQLEKQSTQMAERMSILFGLNAPEFFDKALFRNFISKLQEKNVVTTNAEEKLEYGEQIERVSGDARFVLNSELRQAITQVTSLEAKN
jgi:glycerol-3-phosphate O-acyltransferase